MCSCKRGSKGLTDDPQPTMDPAPKRSKQEAILERLLGKEENTQSQPAPGDILFEVAAFISEKPIKSLGDPLLWWRLNSDRFPHLAALARKHLAVPASSTPSERAFS